MIATASPSAVTTCTCCRTPVPATRDGPNAHAYELRAWNTQTQEHEAVRIVVCETCVFKVLGMALSMLPVNSQGNLYRRLTGIWAERLGANGELPERVCCRCSRPLNGTGYQNAAGEWLHLACEAIVEDVT